LYTTSHPKYPDIIYEVDYGYFKKTTSMDDGGIDVCKGTDTIHITGIGNEDIETKAFDYEVFQEINLRLGWQ